MKPLKIKFAKTDKIAKGVVRVSLSSEATPTVISEDGQMSIVLCVPDRDKVNHRKFFLLCRKAIATAREHYIAKIAIRLADFTFANVSLTAAEMAEAMATNFEIANYEYVEFRTPPPGGWPFVEEITIIDNKISQDVKNGFQKGQTIGQEINDCRAIINAPSNRLDPDTLVEHVEKLFKGTKVKIEVLGAAELQKRGMQGIFSVGKGSDKEPRLIVLHYKNGGKQKPLILVGKTVTFDTGGLCLKPGLSMPEMRMDMAGGAVAIHTLSVAAKLKLKRNVIAIVPTVENILSQTSFRPGDILRMMSGVTVEVLNTDAEGRLILADALTYAKEFSPRLVVDIATLTGAARVALGLRCSAIFTRSDELRQKCQQWGEETGDYVWPLPLWDEYEEELQGQYSDLTNIQTHRFTRYGGAVLAAVFLHQFAKDYPWLHIDIAPRMTSIKGDYLAKGATAEPVRLLTKLLEQIEDVSSLD